MTALIGAGRDISLSQPAHSVGMAHAHAEGAGHNRSVLIKVILLTGGFMLVEATAAIWTNSLALLADAGHMLADVTGLLRAPILNSQSLR
jgi:cobalt-zinc-cadmium efflux system protein